MDPKSQPFEINGHDLVGLTSLDFYDKDNFNTFAAKIANYDPMQFDPVALKVFFFEGNLIVTLYALDKTQEKSNTPDAKLPVQKFKLDIPLHEFIKHVKHFDMVVSDGAYDLKDMLVVNV
jgi:hypothetical protein